MDLVCWCSSYFEPLDRKQLLISRFCCFSLICLNYFGTAHCAHFGEWLIKARLPSEFIYCSRFEEMWNSIEVSFYLVTTISIWKWSEYEIALLIQNIWSLSFGSFGTKALEKCKIVFLCLNLLRSADPLIEAYAHIVHCTCRSLEYILSNTRLGIQNIW